MACPVLRDRRVYSSVRFIRPAPGKRECIRRNPRPATAVWAATPYPFGFGPTFRSGRFPVPPAAPTAGGDPPEGAPGPSRGEGVGGRGGGRLAVRHRVGGRGRPPGGGAARGPLEGPRPVGGRVRGGPPQFPEPPHRPGRQPPEPRHRLLRLARR